MPVVTPATPPESVIRTYYAALDGRRFHDAWDMLSPAVRTALGDFAAWRAGYATTISSHPERIAVELDGQVAAVSHDLAATDRSDCAVVHRRFRVSWRLVVGRRAVAPRRAHRHDPTVREARGQVPRSRAAGNERPGPMTTCVVTTRRASRSCRSYARSRRGTRRRRHSLGSRSSRGRTAPDAAPAKSAHLVH